MTILIATIGTRDLMYQIQSGEWYNVGDDRLQNGQIIGEQFEVIDDLGLNPEEYGNYRPLTEYIWSERELLIDQLKPVIIGKLLLDKAQELSHVYLVVTNQNEEVEPRKKDTIFAGKIIKYWLEKLNNNLQVTIINLGENNENPSDFEQIFKWWQTTWREHIKVNNQEKIILCLKGGVGQTSEAARISGLSLYGEQIEFYEFQQHKTNRQGIPSPYLGPFLGTNYLWDRVRKESLQLLENYNYAAVEEILKPYFQQDTKLWSSTPTLIKASIFWQQGRFESFYNLAKQSLPQRTKYWMAYEQAYTAIVRIEQQNTTEAMLHSFRSVEGLILEWLKENYSQYITHYQPNQYPKLKKTISQEFSNLNLDFQGKNEIILQGWQQIELIKTVLPNLLNNQDFQAFINTRDWRNTLSHNLGGIGEQDLFKAWGVNNLQEWKKRLIKCLNAITQENYSSLYQASLFACLHHQVKEKIAKMI
ncbi:MAG: hypothetical protein EA365_13670 [Gloeocapsa sp. DLM2.Bin57]|nr:MAG: hypothetical protein EA365_13670 [Gloeocapsa sp. DLM2.Bin57]